MKVEEIQHGGDHYKDQPKHLQPIWLGTALNLNPMEYSVLKYLLRHRKKGGLEDLKKMVHFAQMLMEHEYGVCPVVVYPEQDSPSDVSGEEDSEQQPVNVMPHIPQCPFKIGDIVFYGERRDDEPKILWKVWKISPSGVELRGPDADHHYSSIPAADYGKWKNYTEDCIAAEKVVDPDPCPFKVGDMLQHKEQHELKCRVEQINGDNRIIWVRDVESNQAFYIAKAGWRYYEPVPDDSPQPQPCPFQVDDIIQAEKLFENHHCPKWHIYRIEDDKALVSCVEDQQPGEIRRGEWGNYSVVARKAPYRLPVVGELYKGAKTGDIYRVTKVDAADWVYLENTTTKIPHAVQWRLDSNNYKLEESPSTVRYPVVGEIYKGRKSGNMYRVCQAKEEHIRLQDAKSGYTHTVNWNSSLSSDYERVTDETE